MQAPEEIAQKFALAWNKKDAAALAGLFEEDADFVNVVGLWWNDRQAIQKAHDYGFKVIFGGSYLKVTKQKVKFLSDDIAVVHIKIHLTGQSENKGEEALDRRTIFTFVMRKAKKTGLWSCAAAQNTDIVLGAETNLQTKDKKMTSVSYRDKG